MHDKSTQPKTGILCFLKKENEILLCLTDYNGKLLWNGVAGFIETGESPTQATIREAQEEIGIALQETNLQLKGKLHLSSNLILNVFTATNWEGVPEPKEESIKKLEWFNSDSLPLDQMFPESENLADILK